MTDDNEVDFTVPGVPVGKGRPRVGRGVGGHARLFTPEKTVSYEALAAWTAKHAMKGRPPYTGPCEVAMYVHVPVPKSWSRKKAAAALAGALRPITKPDADNVIKAIFDAMNEVVWRDDAQACDIKLTKRYSGDPGVHVIVYGSNVP